jgi:sugar lactone lactonase YvrE
MDAALVRATEERYILAEGPTWDPVRRELLWVDVEAGLVVAGTLRPGGTIAVRETIALGETAGAVAVTGAGDWVIAGAERLFVRSAAGQLVPGRRILPHGCGRRLNDAKPDPAGRYVVGTYAYRADAAPVEELLIVRDDRVDRIDADLTLSNGLAWTADGGTLYSVDTLRRVVFRRPWDPAGGTWGRRTIHLELDAGYPDGICLDEEEHLWVAMWGIGEVRRYAPDATLVGTMRLPAPHVSSVAFAGPDLDVLVITTSSRDLAGEDLARYPAAGALFTARPPVRGLPPNLCADARPLEEAGPCGRS